MSKHLSPRPASSEPHPSEVPLLSNTAAFPHQVPNPLVQTQPHGVGSADTSAVTGVQANNFKPCHTTGSSSGPWTQRTRWGLF